MRRFAILVLFFLPAFLFADGIVIDFDEKDVGKFPSGWKAKEDEGRSVYIVQKDTTGVFLHADSKGNSHTIGYELSLDLADYPYLEFCWRAKVLPPGGDEREKKTNDSVLGVYVIFEGGIIPRSVKYIWSTTLPVGTVTHSPYSKRTQMVVIESGREKIGEWIVERVDVLKDYKRLFGKKKVPPVKGVGILTDSDNTSSCAVGDYLYIKFVGEQK